MKQEKPKYKRELELLKGGNYLLWKGMAVFYICLILFFAVIFIILIQVDDITLPYLMTNAVIMVGCLGFTGTLLGRQFLWLRERAQYVRELSASERQEILEDLTRFKKGEILLFGEKRCYGFCAIRKKGGAYGFTSLKYEDIVWAFVKQEVVSMPNQYSGDVSLMTSGSALAVYDKSRRCYLFGPRSARVQVDWTEYLNQIREHAPRCVIGYHKDRMKVFMKDLDQFLYHS